MGNVFCFSSSSLVYSNIELTMADSKLAIKRSRMNDLYKITVIFKTFGISNFICVSPDGVTVNGKEYLSLFEAFSGVLCFFMQDIRLLYLLRWGSVLTVEMRVCSRSWKSTSTWEMT